MPDFDKLAQTAARLIAGSGQTCTLGRLNTSASDSAQPWRGNSTPESGGETETVTASRVPVSSGLGLSWVSSDLVRRSTAFFLVGPISGTMENFDQITDASGKTWKIQGIEELAPDGTILMYALGVAV